MILSYPHNRYAVQYTHFTDEAAKAQRLNNLPKDAQDAQEVGSVEFNSVHCDYSARAVSP